MLVDSAGQRMKPTSSPCLVCQAVREWPCRSATAHVIALKASDPVTVWITPHPGRGITTAATREDFGRITHVLSPQQWSPQIEKPLGYIGYWSIFIIIYWGQATLQHPVTLSNDFFPFCAAQKIVFGRLISVFLKLEWSGTGAILLSPSEKKFIWV